jgi:hypothetical protein
MGIFRYALPLFVLSAALGQSAPSPYTQIAVPPPGPKPHYGKYDSRLYSYGEALYWRPITQDPMNWAWSRYLFSAFPSPELENNQTLASTYGYTPGFRVGIGGRVPQNYFGQRIRPWCVDASFTRLHATVSNSYTFPGQLSGGEPFINDVVRPLVPYNPSGAIFNELLQTTATASLLYSRGDVRVGWPVWLTRYSTLELFVSGIVASARSRWKIVFQGTPGFDPSRLSTTNLNWNWWGGGAGAGGSLALPVGGGWAFSLDADAGLLFGPLKKVETYESTSINPSQADGFAQNLHRYNAFQPVVDVGLFLEKQLWLANTVRLHLEAGWETSLWFYLNQYGQVNEPSYGTSGALIIRSGVNTFFFGEASGLYFQGATFRAGLEF